MRNATPKRIAKPIVPVCVRLPTNPAPFIPTQRALEIVSFPRSCLLLPTLWTESEVGAFEIDLQILVTRQIHMILVVTLEANLLGTLFTLHILVFEVASSRKTRTICIWTFSQKWILNLLSLIFEVHETFHNDSLVDVEQLQLFIGRFALAARHETLHLLDIAHQNFLLQLISRAKETKGVTAIEPKSLGRMVQPDRLLTTQAALLLSRITPKLTHIITHVSSESLPSTFNLRSVR